MFSHQFKPYADHPDLCVAELPCGDTCNQHISDHDETGTQLYVWHITDNN